MDPITMLFVLSIGITPPTQYEGGAALSAQSIKHHEVCFAGTTAGPCTLTRQVTGLVIDNIPPWTKDVKARTVLTTGAVSAWSNVVSVDNRVPAPPVLRVN